jgi:hypothetical protein
MTGGTLVSRDWSSRDVTALGRFRGRGRRHLELMRKGDGSSIVFCAHPEKFGFTGGISGFDSTIFDAVISSCLSFDFDLGRLRFVLCSPATAG